MRAFFESREWHTQHGTAAGMYLEAVNAYKKNPCFETVAESNLIKELTRALLTMMKSDLEALKIYRNSILTVMLDGSGRHVIRPSATLIDMLMNTEVNVPLSEVQPPHPAVCIELPLGKVFFDNKIGRHEIIEAYVCDRGVNEKDMRTMIIAQKTHNLEIDIESGFYGHKDQIVESIFDDTPSGPLPHDAIKVDAGQPNRDAARASHFRICRLVANLFLYMSQPGAEADVEFRPNTRLVAAKKMPRGPLREATEANFYKSKASQVYIVGFKTEEELKRLTASYEHQGGTKCPHFRRGHWHRYWTGPRDQPELRKTIKRWIKPMIVAAVEGVEAPPTTYVVE